MAAPRVRTGPASLEGPGRPASGGLALALAAGAAGAAAVVYLALTDPYRPGGHLVCPILALTGWYCAGCGAQRAVHSLAHGDLAAAWDMNPLVVASAPVVVLAWVRWLARAGGISRLAGRARTRPPARPAVPPAVSAWLLLAVVATFGVLRNLPALSPALAP